MSQFRYSFNSLLLAVMNIVLLLSTLTAVGSGKTVDAVARGGLSLCTLFFSLLCGLMGNSAPRTLFLSALLYSWGRICLLLAGSFDLHGLVRILLAVVGVSFVTWFLLGPEQLRSSGV